MEVVSYNRYAGFFKRLIAFAIDYLLVRMALHAVLFRIFFLGNMLQYDSVDSIYGVRHYFHWHYLVIEIALMIYFVLCESSSWQGTVGKKLMGMKVVNATSFGKISVAEAVMRFLGKYLSGAFLALGYIWIIFDGRKQGWHDKLANTLVVEA